MTFSTLATYNVPSRHPFRLIIAKGSIVDFLYGPNPRCAAIVCSSEYAAGVDFDAEDAGSDRLKEERINLSISQLSEGKAIMTGPNYYDRLNVRYVIHASGGYGDKSLSSAYASSLKCGRNASLEAIAFSLLSAGSNRGSRSVEDVVKVGLKVIKKFEGYAGLKSIYMCAHTDVEEEALVKLANRHLFSKSVTSLSKRKLTIFGQRKPKGIEREEECISNEQAGSQAVSSEQDPPAKQSKDPKSLTKSRSAWRIFKVSSHEKRLDDIVDDDHLSTIDDDAVSTNSEGSGGEVSNEQDSSSVQNEPAPLGDNASDPHASKREDEAASTESGALRIYNIPATHPFHLVIARGSVVEFSYANNPDSAAVVNSTDADCLGGGAVNREITIAGGRNLAYDLQKLPMMCFIGEKPARCAWGCAVMTGPRSYGRLEVPYVIHCVGGEDNASLSAAYTSSLECGRGANLEAIAFPLISAGSSRGSRGLDEVLRVGLKAIRQFDGYAGLKLVCVFAHAQVEADALARAANEILTTPTIDPNSNQPSPGMPATAKVAKQPSDFLEPAMSSRQAMLEVPRYKDMVEQARHLNLVDVSDHRRGTLSTTDSILMNGSRVSMLDPRSMLNIQRKTKTEVPGDILVHPDDLEDLAGPNKPAKPAKQEDISDLLQSSAIDFTNRGLGDGDIAKVSQALEESSTLESLYMNGNRLSLLEARFTRALAFNRTLKLLWLENNQIHGPGAGMLANGLMLNETIECIHLGRNHIRDEGANRLAEVLHVNKTIRSVGLHHNGIGDYGAQHIADAIMVNKSLKALDLQRNQIGDIGGESLADALLSNDTIMELDLTQNSIDGRVQQKVADILSGNRPLTRKKQPYVNSSLFFERLMALKEPGSDMNHKLEVLSCFITDVHMMKFFYTAVSAFQSLGVVTREAASHHIQRGLSRASETCSCSNSISCFKLILEKSERDGHIQRIDYHRYDNLAEVNRMESAPFIVNIIDAVKSNTARIEGLEANVEAIHDSLESIREGIRHRIKVEATVGFLCASLNVISLGVGGNLVEAAIKALDSIIDYSDLAHIQSVASKWEGCAELVEDGVNMVMEEYADKRLREAVRKKETLTVVSATAAMINAQHLTTPESANSKQLIWSSFDPLESPQPPQENEPKSESVNPKQSISSSLETLGHPQPPQENPVVAEERRPGRRAVFFPALSADRAVAATPPAAPAVDDAIAAAPNSAALAADGATAAAQYPAAPAADANLDADRCPQAPASAVHGSTVPASAAPIVAVGADQVPAPPAAVGSLASVRFPAAAAPLHENEPKPESTNTEQSIASSFELLEHQQPPQQNEQNQFSTKEKCREEVMQWLSSNLPRLQSDDAEKYCECLIEDGFDSLDMLADITEEDLPFMKKAHKQYLTRDKCREEVMQWLSSHLPRLQLEDAEKYCECLIKDGFDSLDMLDDVTEEDLPFMKKAHKRKLIQRMKE